MKRHVLTALWVIIVIFALLIGYIPIMYLLNGVSKGYLELKSQAVLNSQVWRVFLYTHFISGGIAILIGWIQFNKTLQKRRIGLHRIIGKTYFFAAIICSLSGLYIGFFATGGWIAALGFISVACVYFYTTLQGFLSIKKGELLQHQNFMTYSYAVCLAAISLRIYTPIAYFMGFDYISSYKFIAWLAWIPNLAIAYWVNKNRIVSSWESIKITT